MRKTILFLNVIQICASVFSMELNIAKGLEEFNHKRAMLKERFDYPWNIDYATMSALFDDCVRIYHKLEFKRDLAKVTDQTLLELFKKHAEKLKPEYEDEFRELIVILRRNVVRIDEIIENNQGNEKFTQFRSDTSVFNLISNHKENDWKYLPEFRKKFTEYKDIMHAARKMHQSRKKNQCLEIY